MATISTLVVGVLVAAVGTLAARSLVDSGVDARLAERADRVGEVIESQFARMESATTTVAAVRTATADQRTYETRIDELDLSSSMPGVYTFNTLVVLTPGEEGRFVRSMAAAGVPGTAIRPAPDDSRDLLLVIERVAPLATNREALGFDVASNPDAARAATRAVTTGQPSLSDALTLVQEPGDQAGVVIYAPMAIGDDGMSRLSSVVVRGQDLIDDLSGQLAGVGVTVQDPSTEGGDRVIGTVPLEADVVRTVTRDLDVFGQDYRVEVAVGAAFVTPLERVAPGLTAAGLLAIAVLAALLVQIFTRREEHALALVDDRTADLRETNARLADAVAAKDDFLAVMGHELRTPLTVIRGFAATLQAGRAGTLPEAATGLLARIEAQATRLDGLVDDLLVAARLQRRRVTVRRELVDIAVVLGEVADRHRDQVGADGLTVDVAPGLVAHVDPLHLRRIVDSLVANAVRYGAPPIELTAWLETDDVVVDVRDHGTGVPEAVADHIFVPFAQADSGSTRESTGVGLGLAIVRQLCHDNGGSIDLVDDGQPGALFRVRLPRPADAHDPLGTTGPAARRQRGPREEH